MSHCTLSSVTRHIAANLSLRPCSHLAACPLYPTQSGPWIRSLPLHAYSVEGGRLCAVHHSQARLASEYIFVSPHLNCTSGTLPAVHKIVHWFHVYIRFDKLHHIFYHPAISLQSPNSLTDPHDKPIFAKYVLICALFPVNVPDGI